MPLNICNSMLINNISKCVSQISIEEYIEKMKVDYDLDFDIDVWHKWFHIIGVSIEKYYHHYSAISFPYIYHVTLDLFLVNSRVNNNKVTLIAYEKGTKELFDLYFGESEKDI
ncbi:MAG: hypothetical protein JST87_05170 [Bacteroidetes bacterium]|nr:hypothetical protein [Bacteroidota bacterium]